MFMWVAQKHFYQQNEQMDMSNNERASHNLEDSYMLIKALRSSSLKTLIHITMCNLSSNDVRINSCSLNL